MTGLLFFSTSRQPACSAVSKLIPLESNHSSDLLDVLLFATLSGLGVAALFPFVSLVIVKNFLSVLISPCTPQW